MDDETKMNDTSYPTIIEIMKILPYCIPNQWTSQMALLPRSMWRIPPNIEEVLLKIYDTNFPWDEAPLKGCRRIWVRDISPTSKTEVET